MRITALPVKSEALAYWYFRLNGCFTIPNFVVHPDEGTNQRTDVDVIAVRFPYRAELLMRPMQDDPILAVDKRVRVILAEVKTGQCKLNGPWTDQSNRNMERVVRAIGAFQQDLTKVVAASLYATGGYVDSQYNFSLFCIGSTTNEQIAKDFPAVPQVTWDRVLDFLFDRFIRYKNQKVSHPQWDAFGKALWDHAMRARTVDEFKAKTNIIA